MEQTAEDIIRGKTALCFEGGGALGIGHVGSLAEWESMGGYKHLTHVCGSSVGSIAAAAVAAKASIPFMKDTLFGLDLKQFEDNSLGMVRDLYRLIKKWGWNKGDAIEEWAEQLMCKLTGMPEITMEQLYEFGGIHLTMTYWSFRYRKTKFADHITQPKMRVAEVIRMSSSIPIYYQAVWRKFLNADQQEVMDAILDGGTMDNFPMHILREQGVDPSKIMGFKLCGTVELNEYKAERENEDYDYGMPDGIIDALVVLIGSFREQSMHVHVHKKDWMLTVKIIVGDLKSTDFDMTEAQKDWLFENGKAAMRKYLEEVRGYLEDKTHP
jgi:NTE family protein